MVKRLGQLRDRRFLLQRLPWLALSAALIAIGIAASLFQPPRGDAFARVYTLSADWFVHPVEQNAFARLAVAPVELRSVHFLADGKQGWAVGKEGAILATDHGGRSGRAGPAQAYSTQWASGNDAAAGQYRRIRKNGAHFGGRKSTDFPFALARSEVQLRSF